MGTRKKEKALEVGKSHETGQEHVQVILNPKIKSKQQIRKY